MGFKDIKILLADDDKDDCLFFTEALQEIGAANHLQVVHNGEDLLIALDNQVNTLPTIVFIDLNMPRKNGAECLVEIRQNERLQNIPVIICSTSYQPEVIELIYREGARHYICKPVTFMQLKKVIHQALLLSFEEGTTPVSKDKFVLPFKDIL
jgi:CheY-like chemotaxis protein